jgi:hypothetical protein
VTGGIGVDGVGPEACSRPVEPRTVGGAEPAGIAPLDASGGPHGLKTTPHTRFGRPRTGVALVGGRGLGRNGDVALWPRAEAVMAEGHPQDGRRQISQGFFPTAHRRTVNHPGLVPALRLHAREPGGLVPVVAALGPEPPRPRRDVDQKGVAGGEPSAIGRESPARHEVGHGRRGAPVAGPGVQHATHAEAAAQEPGVPRQVLQGLRGAPQQDVVDHLLGAACQRSQRLGSRAGAHAGRDRQPHTLLTCQPRWGWSLVTLGSGPVLTGVGAVVRGLAVWAPIERAAKTRWAARRDVLHDPKRRGRPPVATWSPVLGAMKADEVGYRHQHRSLRRRFMAAAPSGAARTVRGVDTRVGVGARWPRSACMRRRWTPASSRGVAQDWRRV